MKIDFDFKRFSNEVDKESNYYTNRKQVLKFCGEMGKEER
jgi:hypothetical protein